MIFTKKYISNADFLDRTNLPNPAIYNSKSFHRQYDQPFEQLTSLLQKRGSELVEGNVFDISGIRFGIEICLDHRLAVLWSQLEASGDELLDVQLVTSAGMAIERGPNPIKPGGVVYLSDGEASSAACIRTTDDGNFDPSTVCRKPGPGGIKHFPVGGRHSSEFILLSGCIDFLNKTDLLKGYYSIFQTQGCAYTLKLYGIDVLTEYVYYPPSIEIYPVVELPA